MSNIKVPIKEIRDTASKIRDLAGDNSDVFDTMCNIVESSQDEWKGKSMDALRSATSSNKKTFEKALREVENLAVFLEDYAAALEEADTSVKNQIGE